jgi:hypothetical protein
MNISILFFHTAGAGGGDLRMSDIWRGCGGDKDRENSVLSDGLAACRACEHAVSRKSIVIGSEEQIAVSGEG